MKIVSAAQVIRCFHDCTLSFSPPGWTTFRIDVFYAEQVENLAGLGSTEASPDTDSQYIEEEELSYVCVS